MDKTTIISLRKFCECRRVEGKVNNILAKCSSFKIGKTGMSLLDRKNEPDYANVYENIQFVYNSSDAKQVSDMETYLIDKYITSPKCDNLKDGNTSNSDSMTDDTEMYYVYVVWR